MSVNHDVNELLSQTIRNIYNKGPFNDLAPPVEVLKYLEKFRTLFLCDAELCNEDIHHIGTFLSSKAAISCIDTIEICRTSLTQVKYRRVNENNSSSLNLNNCKLFRDVINFIRAAKCLRKISFQDIDIRNDVIQLLGIALASTESPLSWLNFVSCNIDADIGFKLLTPSIGKMQYLSVLSIEQCGLTDLSIPYVSSIIKAHSSKMDSLYWNSALRIDITSAGQQEKEDSLLGKGLVAVSLYGNRIRGNNIRMLTKLLRDNDWLLAINFADNQLEHDSIAVILDDLLSSGNKMRAVLLRNNPGLESYTAKALLASMQRNALISKESTEIKKNASHFFQNELYSLVDVQKRFQMLPSAERLLLEHWMKLQVAETDFVRPNLTKADSVVVKQKPLSGPIRYVSPSMSRYSRSKISRQPTPTASFDRNMPSRSGYRTIDAVRHQRESVDVGSNPITNDFLSLRRSSEANVATNVDSSDTMDVLNLLKSPSHSQWHSVLHTHNDGSRVVDVAVANALKQKSLTRRLSESTQLSRSREWPPSGRSRSPTPVRSNRQRSLSEERRGAPGGLYYDKILRSRELHDIMEHRWQSLIRDRKNQKKISSDEVRTLLSRRPVLAEQEPSDDERRMASLDVAKKLRLQRKAKKKASGEEGLSRRRAESENTEVSAVTDSKADAAVERNAVYLNQCITSVLAASSHLEQVSMKLQGVVETLSDSVNLSMSMQQSTQQNLLMHSRQSLANDVNVLQLDDSMETIDDYGQRERHNNPTSLHDSSIQHNQIIVKSGIPTSITESKPAGRLRGPSTQSISRLDQRGKIDEEQDGDNKTNRPIAGAGSESDVSLSDLIKQRMHDKLRALLGPELIIS